MSSPTTPWTTKIACANAAVDRPKGCLRGVRGDPRGIRGRLRTRAARRQVESVEMLARTPSFARLRDEIIAVADPHPGDRVLDLGAGSGLLALAVAPLAGTVIAVDRSPEMCLHLARRAVALALENVTVVEADAVCLPLPEDSVDLVLSNYCLHHLNDAAKRQALRELARVLRPEGRVVIGDMMFALGLASARDRHVLASFALGMLSRGPAGFARLLKNAVKVLFAPSEHPADLDWWRHALSGAGFADVGARELEREAGLVWGRRAG
jgi:SAM-dependent methyltransferase